MNPSPNGPYILPKLIPHTLQVVPYAADSEVFGYSEEFKFPQMPQSRLYELSDVIEKKVDKKYTLSDKLWNYLYGYAINHKEKGNGFGYGLFDARVHAVTRTISARYYKDGAEILIPQENKSPRRLTIREAARLQGYPEKYIVDVVSMNQAYKQFGNSVVVPLIQAVGKSIVDILLMK